MKLLKETHLHLGKGLIVVLALFFSCNYEKNVEDVNINLLEIEVDYHFLNYSDLRNTDELYSPENLIFTFEVLNEMEKRFDELVYTKLDQNDNLPAFFLTLENNASKLFTSLDHVVLGKNEKIELTAELPFKSYGIVKEGLKELSQKGTVNNLKKVNVIFRKETNKEFDASALKVQNPKISLVFMDTVIFINQ